MGYFIKTIRPDIINGDVSNVIQSNKSDLPFATGDILFDWTPIDVPLRTNAIVDCNVHMYGEDGSHQPSAECCLIFAKSNSGAAPTTLGTVNAAPSSCYELPDIMQGILKLEAGGNVSGAGVLELAGIGGSIYYWNVGSASGQTGPVVLDLERNGLGGATTNRIYVAGIVTENDGFDFSTGVLANGAVTSDSATSITTKTVDPRNAFRVGDTVYLHDVDTALGTIASMTATNITLNAAIAGGTDIADEDEFMNAKPITINLGFSSGKQ